MECRTVLSDVYCIFVHVLKESSAHIIRVGASPELGNGCSASFKNAWGYASARSMYLLDVQSPSFFFFFLTIFYRIMKLPAMFHFHLCVSL
jgi:hypothetical protein